MGNKYSNKSQYIFIMLVQTKDKSSNMECCGSSRDHDIGHDRIRYSKDHSKEMYLPCDNDHKQLKVGHQTFKSHSIGHNIFQVKPFK